MYLGYNSAYLFAICSILLIMPPTIFADDVGKKFRLEEILKHDVCRAEDKFNTCGMDYEASIVLLHHYHAPDENRLWLVVVPGLAALAALLAWRAGRRRPGQSSVQTDGP